MHKKPPYKKEQKNIRGQNPSKRDNDPVRLNKYIANSGVCSRREADQLIQSGVVQVNGTVVTELGTKVTKADKVKIDSQVIKPEKNVYVLLNKPKDYITTAKDTHNRKTVMMLVNNACDERIYPVGRLDRTTTGVLLFTNDGEMAKKLTHPKHNIKKIYHVTLDQKLKKKDLEQISNGVELDDGFTPVDEIAYNKSSADSREIGIEIHSGKNRIVRRIFEHFGYKVIKLDRVYFAGLTKKNLKRGKWRLLTQEEIILLKRQ